MFKVSCIQLRSDDNLENNLKKTIYYIKKAVSKKSDFILTPETSSFFSLKKSKLLKVAKTMNEDKYLKEIKKISKLYRKWILIGSVITKIGKKKLVNRSVLIGPDGKIKTYYDKIHMYDAKLSKKEYYFESKLTKPGKKIKKFKLPWGILGMSICYDLRFPNMFRKLAKTGSIFISIPSAFTKTTGEKHWHTLLRARAIENFSYVFAPAQSGIHYNKRVTYGHSLIISPDGKIIAEKAKGEGIISANIDPTLPNKIRKKIPSLKAD